MPRARRCSGSGHIGDGHGLTHVGPPSEEERDAEYRNDQERVQDRDKCSE